MATAGRDLGRYELLLELARGGMAELWLARLRGAGGFEKLVAIKRILPHLAQDRQFTDMFLQEGRIASQLTHPNICQVFELDELDGQLFLAMEYLEGASWADIVAAGRPEPRLTAAVLAQAAEGLHDAHSLRDLGGNPTPIVHRDVSPQNIFVTVDGVAKVLDFGVSKMITEGPRTADGVLKGKLPYMAPEQIRGEPLDGRADVFALGACAWEALTGHPLFHRATDFMIWKAITEDPIPTVRSRWPQCPPHLEAVVMQALARARDERHPSAKIFADELRGAAGFASAAEIADALRATCGTQLAARTQEVATALSSRRPSRESLPPTTPDDEDAAATVDLRRQQAVTAPALQLRDRSLVVERATPTSESAVVTSAPTSIASTERSRFAPPAPVPPPAVHTARPARARRRVHVGVIAGVLVAVVVTVIVVLAIRRSSPPEHALQPPASDPPVVTRSDPADHIDNAVRELDKLPDRLDRLHEGLDRMREALHGNTPDSPGTLVLESNAPTKIYAGDKLLGDTPLKVELPPGTYALRAVHEDGREKKFSVAIVAGTITTSDAVQTW